MQITGKLIKKLDIESGISKSEKEWRKQGVLIEQIDTDYNKEVVVTFFGDKINTLQNVEVGDTIEVSVNLSSREYNGKYYHNIDGWWCVNKSDNALAKAPAIEENMPF